MLILSSRRKIAFFSYADTLEFWKTHEKDLPYLSKQAKILLSIPATSASVERFFSKTGYIMRPHRRRLSDMLAEKLFFFKVLSYNTDVEKNDEIR